MARPLLFPTALFAMSLPFSACVPSASAEPAPTTAPTDSAPPADAAADTAVPAALDPSAPADTAEYGPVFSATSRSGNARAPSYDDRMQQTKARCTQDCPR